jgi:protease I
MQTTTHNKIYFLAIILVLHIVAVTNSAATELSFSESLKATPLVPTINTAYLFDKNPELKNFFLAPVTKQEIITNKHIAILATDGVEEFELLSFLVYLKARGAKVDVISPQESPWPEQYAVQYPVARAKFIQTVRFMQNAGSVQIDRFIDEVKAADYDAAVIPGGAWSPDFLRNNKHVLKFVQEINKANKPIASICHGPWVLINAEIVKGKKMTAAWNIHKDLQNAGALVEDKPVVIDGNIMTSRYPTDLAGLIAELVRQIQK